LPFILIDDLGLTPFQFAMAMLVQTASFISGNLIASALAARTTGQRIITLALALLALGGLGFVVLPILFPQSVMALIVPFGIGMMDLAFSGLCAWETDMAGFGALLRVARLRTGFFLVNDALDSSSHAGTLLLNSQTELTAMM